MAQLNTGDVLRRTIATDYTARSNLRGLVDRSSGRFLPKEGLLIDYKEILDPSSVQSVAETARDVLAFSNTEGGILLFGVRDDGSVVGHKALDSNVVRQGIGKYAGTRVSYEVGNLDLSILGISTLVSYMVVRRTDLACPNLLRADIEATPPVAQKVKYRAGSLFYREEDRTIVEPLGEGLHDRALALGFTYATPRAKGTMILAQDRPGYRVYDHINDRFYGRDADVAEILGKIDNPKGRGVSIAGFGGIGKTELAIEVVLKLIKQRKFKRVYSGSAKTLMMTPLGRQHVDPIFYDYKSFVVDLAAWQGLEAPSNPSEKDVENLSVAVVNGLSKSESTLMFLDNLETGRPGTIQFHRHANTRTCYLVDNVSSSQDSKLHFS